MKHTYIADRLFTGQEIISDIPLTIEDDRILSFETVEGVAQSRLPGLLVPGYIDIQVNGGGGILFNQNPAVKTLDQIFTAHAAFGTTGFLPTLITDNLEVMKKAADAVSSARARNMPGILGIHFEGPHISMARKGVHEAGYIRELSEDELCIYARDDIGICHLTVAPEMLSPDSIRLLTDMGVIVSLGHSDATFEETAAALDAGARGFTHLYNAMSQLQGRAPGMVGAALLSRDSWCGIIMDGYHLHDQSARLAISTKARGKIMLVTDAMSPVGTSEAEFDLLGEKVMRHGNKLTIADGRLAGSVLDMAMAVRNSKERLGLSLKDSLRMASLYPAEYLGIDHETGTLDVGKRADFILLDDNLNVRSSWVCGVRK